MGMTLSRSMAAMLLQLEQPVIITEVHTDPFPEVKAPKLYAYTGVIIAKGSLVYMGRVVTTLSLEDWAKRNNAIIRSRGHQRDAIPGEVTSLT